MNQIKLILYMEFNHERQSTADYIQVHLDEIREIYHHPNCYDYIDYSHCNDEANNSEAIENFTNLRTLIQNDIKSKSEKEPINELKCGCTLKSQNEPTVDLDLYSKLYDLERDNAKLSDNLEFALELLDLVLGYVNHYFNIVFSTEKSIPLNKFKINEVKEVLQSIEERLFSLSQAEAELLRMKHDQLMKYNDSNHLSRTISTNAQSRDNLKYLKDDSGNRITELESKLNNLLEQNNSLKNTIVDLNKKLEAKKKKPKKIKKFDSKELNGQTAFSFEILCDDNYTVFDGISVGRKGSEISSLTKKSKKSRKKLGKFKVIESGNLYDKYSNKKTDSYISGHWAMDGYESVVKKEGKLTKVIKALVVDKLDLDKKQIIPAKPLNYGHILNKQNEGSKMGSTMTVRTVKFQDGNSVNEAEKHKFD